MTIATLSSRGARSALPIWTEFMKRAHQQPEYRNVHEFAAPSGVVTARIDAEPANWPRPTARRCETKYLSEEPSQSQRAICSEGCVQQLRNRRCLYESCRFQVRDAAPRDNRLSETVT